MYILVQQYGDIKISRMCFFHLFLLLKIKCKIKLLNETASKRFLCFTSNKINSRYTVRWRIREESPVTNSNAPVQTVA